MTEHRKQVRHYHEPGDLHELTFSCYQRMPILTNDTWREMLCRSIDKAVERWEFRLAAFVLMPEHVHLLVYPTSMPLRIDNLLSAIKQPYSVKVKQQLISANSPLLQQLTIPERPGKMVFRYWQEGPGYDRNLWTESVVLAAIDYIHNNPVRRGLVKNALEWRWSSARWYASEDMTLDSALPMIHGLPPEFFR